MQKLERGENNSNKIFQKINYVSNSNGIISNYTFKEFESREQFPVKLKRDTEIFSNNTSLKQRRIVKKLIRVQPVNRNSNSIHDFVNDNRIDATTQLPKRKHGRRRVLIKKKRKHLNRTNQTVTPSKSRRKVVVTRKRLISKHTQIPEMTESPIISESSASSVLEMSIENTLSTASMVSINIETSIEPKKTTYLDDKSTEAADNKLISENHVFQDETHLPNYEPFFPELSESLDDPIILLKTTVITSVGYETKTVVQSRLRTYTFVVTRVNGDEQIITSTTEVKPQTKTIVITEPTTKLTTLTLLDLDATETLPFIPKTVNPSAESSTHFYTDFQGEFPYFHVRNIPFSLVKQDV